MLLIKNGRVVDPVTNTDRKLDVLVDGAVRKHVRFVILPLRYHTVSMVSL